ncbi:MAG: amidohydrolase [Sphingomonas bacterium]
MRGTAAIGAIALAQSALAAPLDDAQRAQVLASAKKQEAGLSSDALAIWNYAEVGYKEVKSSALLQDRLRKNGFTVRAGVAGMPTAFVASFRNGAGPVIGILAEYDALPGLSQDAVPDRKPTPGKDAAHGCGHNLFGAASVASAIALKDWMTANGVKGEVRVYGSPAEEGGSGKVYLVRDGLFNDVDAVLHWHPGDDNSVTNSPSMANISGKFRFHGLSAHAAAAPDQGRSALDAVQVMNIAVEHLREHIPDRTRIHYVITSGGKAPNVVPDFAEVYYYVRQANPQIVRDVWARVVKASQGAAIATETTTDYEITGGVYSLLPNNVLADVAMRNFRRVPIDPWNAEQMAFANEMTKNLPKPGKLDPTIIVEPRADDSVGGSTDVSDVSWTVPTIGISTTTWVPGTPAHSWQSSAASGTTLGVKGAIVAQQALSMMGAELLQSPDVIAKAKAELNERRGPDFAYKAMLGDRKPALNYRDGPSQ